MRISTVRGAGLSLVVAAGLVGVVGCSHSEDPNSPKAAMERREKTVSDIDNMRDELKKADAQIVATQQSLDRLSSQQAGDLSATYKQFSQDVSKNRSQAERINGQADSLAIASYRQMNDWNYQARTIRNDQLKQESLKQEVDARKNQEAMVAALNDVRASYLQYVRQLTDIDTFAAADLTPKGVAGLSSETQKANETADALRMKLARLDGRLGTLATAWSTNAPLSARLTPEELAQPAGSTQSPANAPADSEKR